MSIQQNFPAITPSLSLNFARSKKLDPRITFTRTSSATRINETGLVEVVPANAPRFDHSYDSVSGSVRSLGLLVEESRTNLLLRSEDFGDDYWFKARCSISVNTIAAPDGNVTADTLIEDESNNTHRLLASAAIVTANSVVTFSVYFKAKERSQINLYVDESTAAGGAFFSAYYSSSGVTGSSSGGGASYTSGSVQALGNGWYRASIIGTLAGGYTSYRCSVFPSVNGSINYQGDGTSGIYLWGAQLETGAFPTSYIPTTTSTVTRTADNVSMVGENFSSWYNQSEGTVYADTRIVGVQTARFDRLWAITNSNLNQDGLGLFISGPSGTFGIYDITTTIGGVTQYPEAGGTLGTSGMGITASSTPRLKSCFGFTTGNTNISYNGRLPNSSGVTITNLLTADRLFIGQPQRFQGHSCMTISQLTYYPRRLTNAQLVTLTR
jgi:hypothetical protein